MITLLVDSPKHWYRGQTACYEQGIIWARRQRVRLSFSWMPCSSHLSRQNPVLFCTDYSLFSLLSVLIHVHNLATHLGISLLLQWAFLGFSPCVVGPFSKWHPLSSSKVWVPRVSANNLASHFLWRRSCIWVDWPRIHSRLTLSIPFPR